MAATDGASAKRRVLRALASCVACVAIATAHPALAVDHVTGTVLYYSDSDKVHVLSPTLAGSVEVGRVFATARTSVDIISAASVDLVTAASPRGFTEQRVEVDMSAGYDLGEGRKVDTLFGVSREPDFLTYTAGAGASWDVLRRNATLGLRYAFSHSTVGRTDDALFSRVRVQHQAELSVSRLLSPSAVVDVLYAPTLIDGYQANPYRYVRIYKPGADAQATAVAERVPDLRVRHAAALRLRKRLAPALFGLAEYRAYADTWGMLAHSLLARAAVTAGRFTFTAEGRVHHQTRADFYRKRYETFPSAPDLRTADKMLGPMWTLLGGLHAEWGLPIGRLHTLRLGAGGDVLQIQYLDYAFLTSRTATMASFDVTWEH